MNGNKQKLLIIMGSHPNAASEVLAMLHDYPDADLMAIGLDAVDRLTLPIKYVATYHSAELERIRNIRESVGGNLDYIVISQREYPGVHVVIQNWWKPSGSSSLLGVQAAISNFDYKKIVLCGCPLEGVNSEKQEYANYRAGWEKHFDKISNHVRSVSGWTKELLGAPSEEWLHG